MNNTSIIAKQLYVVEPLMKDDTYYSLVPSFDGPKPMLASLSSSDITLFSQPCGLSVAPSIITIA